MTAMTATWTVTTGLSVMPTTGYAEPVPLLLDDELRDQFLTASREKGNSADWVCMQGATRGSQPDPTRGSGHRGPHPDRPGGDGLSGREPGRLDGVLSESPACGTRLVRPWSLFVSHSVAGAGSLYARDMASQKAAMVAINRAVAALVGPRIGMTPEALVARIYSEEWWVAGLDAVQAGWADAVVLPFHPPRA